MKWAFKYTAISSFHKSAPNYTILFVNIQHQMSAVHFIILEHPYEDNILTCKYERKNEVCFLTRQSTKNRRKKKKEKIVCTIL